MDKVYTIVCHIFKRKHDSDTIRQAFTDLTWDVFKTYELALKWLKTHNFTVDNDNSEYDFRYELIYDKYDNDTEPCRIIQFKEYPKGSTNGDEYMISTEYYSIREMDYYDE